MKVRDQAQGDAGAASSAVSARRPLRIVMVVHSHLLGGMERRTAATAQLLAERGHQLAYAGPMDGWLGERMRADGHTCVDIGLHGMYDAWSAWRLARFARQWRADVLHGQAQRGGRYADWAGRWAGVASVISPISMVSGRWFRPHMRLLAISDAVRAQLLLRGLPPQQIEVVYPAVPDIGHSAVDTAALNAQRPLRLLINARQMPVKGQDVALAALARLPADLPVQLSMTGATDTEWAQQMQAQVQALGLQSRVRFLGQRQDVPQLLGDCDVLLAPSRHEALSITLIECACAGRPAIASAVGGIPEVVRDGVSGLLVPAEDPAALATAIVRLAQDAGLRQRLGAAARQQYEQRFSPDSMVANTLAAYDAAMRARLPAPARTR